MSNGFFFPFFGGQPPSEEQLAEQKVAEERRQMEIQAFQHDFQRLFEELSLDQLRTLRIMLQFTIDGSGSHGNNLAISWDSMIAWEMKHRHNICVTCGKNHDEEIGEPGPDVPTEKEVVVETEAFNLIGVKPDGMLDIPTVVRKQMDEYHLDDAYDMDESGKATFRGFACTGIKGLDKPCGVTYPTIEDRMKKDPETCSGCFQRMMHG